MLQYVLLIVLVVLFGLYVIYRSNAEHFVRVTGFGIVKKAPDEASVIIGYRSENITKESLSTERSTNAAQFKKIIDIIRQIAPSAQIETRTFLVSPVYSVEPNVAERFTIYSSVNVRVNGADQIPILSQIIDQSIAAGSNSVGSVQYSLSDALRKVGVEEAQAGATKDANGKAFRLATLSSRSLGSVQQIIDNDSSVHFYRADLSAVPPATTVATPLLPPQEIEINTQLTIQYLLF